MNHRHVITVLLQAALILLLAIGAAWASDVSQPAPKLVLEETAFNFDPVVDGALVNHDFAVRNEGDAVLHINQVKTG
ncbi:MAG: hypothetical protein QNJ22_03985 [Desulfosarcinaceae bacterium]|nr:hypothetical protein [Desulfosarcinaceae bacterium]